MSYFPQKVVEEFTENFDSLLSVLKPVENKDRITICIFKYLGSDYR